MKSFVVVTVKEYFDCEIVSLAAFSTQNIFHAISNMYWLPKLFFLELSAHWCFEVYVFCFPLASLIG